MQFPQFNYALFLLLLLGGCRAVAPPAEENSVWSALRDNLETLNSWQLGGRVNVRYYDEAYTPRIRWQQQDNTYNIRLWGTFNAGNTTIEGRPGLVTLEQDGEVLTASSPEDLILQQLGYELPVSHLEYWIRGLPAPDSDAALEFNDLNQLSQLVQDGWTVSYPDPRQYGDMVLPRRVDMNRDGENVRLRFVGLSWTLDQ
jgi:outer membrane lipoprotein LolB